MSLTYWLRAVRARFFISDVVNVATGLAMAWGLQRVFYPFLGLLTLIGILLLRSSVNLLNDYFDHVKGIDTNTVRTPFSGGSGVIQEGLLEPAKVYRAGVALLLVSIAIGAYLTVERGLVVLLLLGAGALAVYFYTTKVAQAGLSEVVLTVERALIIIGSFYVQVGVLLFVPVYVGFLTGILFATVIFLSQFPDVEADAKGGRRGIVIRLGVRRASLLYSMYPAAALLMTLYGAISGFLPALTLLSLASAPVFVILAIRARRYASDRVRFIGVMANNSLVCTIVNLIFVASFII
ncbi:MAG: prenyltransferase [Nitrososphaerota archaeon]|nr:prenyltransferase [Nitrososphaerota archaeon]